MLQKIPKKGPEFESSSRTIQFWGPHEFVIVKWTVQRHPCRSTTELSCPWLLLLPRFLVQVKQLGSFQKRSALGCKPTWARLEISEHISRRALLSCSPSSHMFTPAHTHVGNSCCSTQKPSGRGVSSASRPARVRDIPISDWISPIVGVNPQFLGYVYIDKKDFHRCPKS